MNRASNVVGSDDLNEISVHLERSDAELVLLGGGPMQLSALYVALDFMHIASVRSGCPAVLRGTVPAGRGVVLRTSPASAPFRLDARSISSDRCVFARGGTRLAVYLPENCSVYAFSTPSHYVDPPGRPRAQVRVPDPEHGLALRSCISLLTMWRGELAHDDDADWKLRRDLEGILRPIAPTLWSDASVPLPDSSGRVVRVCAVTRACAYIDTHLHGPLTLQQLCDVAGVRSRTLEYGFRECYEVGPMSYLRSVRLCRVRRDLARPHAEGVSVAKIARKWCFTHMGQFGRDYRLLFGETPSMTLNRAGRRSTPIAQASSRAP